MSQGFDALSSFTAKPVKSFEQAGKLRKQVEDKLNQKAIAIESDLENSFVTANSTEPYQLNYFTKRHDDSGPAPLIAESLMTYNALRKDKVDLHRKLSDAIKLYQDASNEEAVSILRQVRDYIPPNFDEGYSRWVDDGSGGKHYSGLQIIVVKKVPKYFFDDIYIPQVMKPLVSMTYSTENNVDNILAHEFSHAWLSLNADNYSGKDVSGAINEMMAYYTGYVVSGYQFSNSDSNLYDRSDLITWGLQLLVDKSEEFKQRGGRNTGIDFGRRLMLKIYNNAVNGSNSDFKIVLRACLLKEDKKRLQRFRRLDEEIGEDLGKIKHLMYGDVEGTLRGTEEGKKIREIASKVTWENPERMEKVILQNILRKAVKEEEYGGLEWVNYQITRELNERLDMLDKYLQAFDAAGRGLNEGQFKEVVKECEKNIIELEKKLKTIIADGEISSATLKNAPAIIK